MPLCLCLYGLLRLSQATRDILVVLEDEENVGRLFQDLKAIRGSAELPDRVKSYRFICQVDESSFGTICLRHPGEWPTSPSAFEKSPL